MFIANTPVTITWDLAPTLNAAWYSEDLYGFEVIDPDSRISYLPSGFWADTFVAPSATTAGSLTHTYTFAKAGVYTLSLCDGFPDTLTVLAKRQFMVVQAKVTESKLVRFPVYVPASFTFDGIDGSLTTPDTPSLELTGEVLTWEVIGVRVDDWDAPNQILVSQTVIFDESWSISFSSFGAYLNRKAAASLGGLSGFPVVFPQTPGETYDFKWTHNTGTGQSSGYYAVHGEPYGTPTNAGAIAGPLANSGAELKIGGLSEVVSSLYATTGTLQSFTLHDDARLAVSWNAADYASGTTMVSGGVTWTLNGGVSLT